MCTRIFGRMTKGCGAERDTSLGCCRLRKGEEYPAEWGGGESILRHSSMRKAL